MTTINWNVTTEDFDAIAAIARRARTDLGLEQRSTLMDLNATHANGNPLDLAGLLTASPGDFAHDVGGIQRYIDRETGQLTEFFTPRYSLSNRAQA